MLTLHAAGIAAEHVQLYAFLRFAGPRIVPHSEAPARGFTAPSGRGACIDRMAALLYLGLKPSRRGLQRQLFVLVTVHWFMGLKIYLGRMFPDLFRPAADALDESDLRAAHVGASPGLDGRRCNQGGRGSERRYVGRTCRIERKSARSAGT